jgi:hypothetical protein
VARSPKGQKPGRPFSRLAAGGWRTRWPCGVSWAWRWTRVPAGSLDDFAHAAADRSGHASRSIRLGVGRAGRSWLLKGQRIAIDATTLEAKAALRSMVRRDAGENYEEFLGELAKVSGIATPRAKTWRGWIVSARSGRRIRSGRAQRMAMRGAFHGALLQQDRKTLFRKLSRAEIKGVSVTSSDLSDVERFS